MIYEKIECGKELPDKQDYYNTSHGELYFKINNSFRGFCSSDDSERLVPFNPVFWFKPTELKLPILNIGSKYFEAFEEFKSRIKQRNPNITFK